MGNSWPGPIEVFEHYLRSREGYSSHKASLLGSFESIDRTSRFWAKTPGEIEDAFREMSAELDVRITMQLLASCEARLRTDFFERIKRRRKDQAGMRFRIMEGERKAQKRKGVRLEDIIGVWADVSAGKSAGPLRRLLSYRHWIAHGRFWVDKRSGFGEVAPFEARNIRRRFFNTLDGFAPLPAQSP